MHEHSPPHTVKKKKMSKMASSEFRVTQNKNFYFYLGYLSDFHCKVNKNGYSSSRQFFYSKNNILNLIFLEKN